MSTNSLEGHGLVYSKRAAGSCPDNAMEEGFLGTLKSERVRRGKYLTRGEARADIFLITLNGSIIQ